MNNKKIIVRFAPSPTGPFHLGSARTALYNYLFAKKENGVILLRIEDTDKERSEKKFEDEIYDSLKWLGIDYSKKILKSSERTKIYKEKLQELIKNNFAYISKESEGQNKEVVRFKNPGGKIKFTDLIRGNIEEDISNLKDFIIAKNLEEPLYHLAVVVDDIESGVTHIIRGEDHISNTARQILIARALGKKEDFQYAHLPLILAKDKSKLSKRKHGKIVSLKKYKDLGYSPEAILNFLAFIGWNPGGEKEIFSTKELIKTFDIKKVQKKGGIFNIEKLNWLNREYILRQPKIEQLENFRYQLTLANAKFKNHQKLNNQKFVENFLEIILNKIHRWAEVEELVEAREFDYLFEKPILDVNKILWKKQDKNNAREKLKKVLEIITSPNLESQDNLKWDEVMKYAEKEGKGEVLWPLRYALSGREKSPDPFTLIKILGAGESKKRIEKAIKLLT